jgi:hypothetical protein
MALLRDFAERKLKIAALCECCSLLLKPSAKRTLFLFSIILLALLRMSVPDHDRIFYIRSIRRALQIEHQLNTHLHTLRPALFRCKKQEMAVMMYGFNVLPLSGPAMSMAFVPCLFPQVL